MSYKTILVHCDASRTVGNRLTAAADVAQRFEARLVGLHAREPFEVVSFVDGGMALEPLMEAYRAGCEAAEKTAQSAYDKAIKGRNFPSEWRVTEAFSDDALAVSARYADLLVVGQSDPDDPAGGRNDLPEAMAFATGRPVLVVPHIGTLSTVGTCTVVVHNDSAVVNSTLAGTVASLNGSLCIRVFDVGALTAPVDYTITVNHP